MAEAVVKDEQKREDPTVIPLRGTRARNCLTKREAVFVPTATMANQIALRVLSEPGDEVLAEGWRTSSATSWAARRALRARDEADRHRGRALRPRSRCGMRSTARRPAHGAPTRVLCLENTHNAGGGRVWPL